MISDGELVDDKPNGSAICLYEGEYEECGFYKGKRIDTLYMMRLENANMQQQMARMQKGNSDSGRQSKDAGEYAMDAIKEEGVKRAADCIFDKLFQGLPSR